jgi:5-hydroxyisourate hydrolase
MSAITTHVLDTGRGRPAIGVHVELEIQDASGAWRRIGHGATDSDGRLRTLLSSGDPLAPGAYRLVFDAGKYFGSLGIATFFPRVTVEFVTAAGEPHYHVPLLLSPFGYTTYRGT